MKKLNPKTKANLIISYTRYRAEEKTISTIEILNYFKAPKELYNHLNFNNYENFDKQNESRKG